MSFASVTEHSPRQQRWLRIIPVALIMYTIAYVDRTNVTLAMEPKISSLMRDLSMDNVMKGQAMGIFFFGYALLQMAGGYWATRWGGRKVVSVMLVTWGVCAVGCGLARTFEQFKLMRFFLGVAEGGVFPATAVLMANWFPRSERARATAYWLTCQPLAVAVSSPITGSLLGTLGWQKTLILEGILPLFWLPIWWFCIRDHPREAKWISTAEKNHLESTLSSERANVEPPIKTSWLRTFAAPSIFIMTLLYFLHNCAAYGCMTFFTKGLEARGFSPLEYGILFSIPYALTAVIMVINSRHSDRTQERRFHVAAVYLMSGTSLILSVLLSQHFWVSYVLLCFAIPGPFAAMGPFWAIPAETLPRGTFGAVIGLVNAIGNLGGWAGPNIVGRMSGPHTNTALPFTILGSGMLVCVGLAFLLPKSPKQFPAAFTGTPLPVPAPSVN